MNLSEIKYKCEKHRLDIACIGCIKAHINIKERLLEFVKKAQQQSCCNMCNCLSCDATKVLMEIGEA